MLEQEVSTSIYTVEALYRCISDVANIDGIMNTENDPPRSTMQCHLESFLVASSQ